MTSATWSYPTEFRFGPGRVAEVADACRSAGIESPLLVTDPGLVDLRPVAAVRASLASAGLTHGLFSGVRSNPTGEDVELGVALYRSGGHDGVVAVGGGSALDVGKVVAFMSGQARPVTDFEDVGDNWTRADGGGIAPVIAVPTTAGTGSEVGRAGVITDSASRRKLIVFHPAILPVVVIADPAVTVDLPRVLTVGTGLDALSHCLEAICSPGLHPMSHGIGVEGCRMVLEHLPRVVDEPGDLESRGQMLIAAAMGAVAFQKGLGAMHALAHPIGAHFDTHHGMTNAVLMPYVLAANRDEVQPTVERLASYVGIDGGYDGFLGHVLEIRDRFEVPHTLVELGVDPDAVDTIAADAVRDPSAAGNPVPVDLAFAGAVFDSACEGRLGR